MRHNDSKSQFRDIIFNKSLIGKGFNDEDVFFMKKKPKKTENISKNIIFNDEPT